MKPEIPIIIKLLQFYDSDRVKHFDEVGLNIDSRVIDDSKVSDHHAIIPTKDIPNAANMELTADEKAILDLVIKRFFLAFEQVYVYNETAYIFEIEGNSFKLTVKEPVSLGWKAYISEKTEEKQGAKAYNEGDTFTADNLSVKDCETTPPRAFTESSLLSAMENVDKRIEDKDLKQYVKVRGLGTTATRAAIIERIISLEYVARDKKALKSTEKGRYLIAYIPEAIKSVEMTAEMESQLVAVENGESSPEAVIESAVKLVHEVMEIEGAKQHENIGEVTKVSNEITEMQSSMRDVISKAEFYFSNKDKRGDAMFIAKLAAAKETLDKFNISSIEDLTPLKNQYSENIKALSRTNASMSELQKRQSALLKLQETHQALTNGNYIDNLTEKQKVKKEQDLK